MDCNLFAIVGAFYRRIINMRVGYGRALSADISWALSDPKKWAYDRQDKNLKR